MRVIFLLSFNQFYKNKGSQRFEGLGRFIGSAIFYSHKGTIYDFFKDLKVRVPRLDEMG
jgi:hypothetical protein